MIPIDATNTKNSSVVMVWAEAPDVEKLQGLVAQLEELRMKVGQQIYEAVGADGEADGEEQQEADGDGEADDLEEDVVDAEFSAADEN